MKRVLQSLFWDFASILVRECHEDLIHRLNAWFTYQIYVCLWKTTESSYKHNEKSFVILSPKDNKC